MSENISPLAKVKNHWKKRPTKDKMYWTRLGITFLISSLLGILGVYGFWGGLVLIAYQLLLAVTYQRVIYRSDDLTFGQSFRTGLITSIFMFIYFWMLFFNWMHQDLLGQTIT